jgi:hypothetical protein
VKEMHLGGMKWINPETPIYVERCEIVNEQTEPILSANRMLKALNNKRADILIFQFAYANTNFLLSSTHAIFWV